jgi:hypothetical protein
MSLYQLCYSVGDAFEGVVFLEARSHGAALWAAKQEGIAPNADCHVIELHPDDARVIPSGFIGRLLGVDELAELERILMSRLHRKPAAPSARRRTRGLRARA